VEGNDAVGNLNFDLTSLGLPVSLIKQLAYPNFFGIWALTGYSQLGFNPGFEYNNTYSSQVNLTKVWGSHTLKAGMDLRRWHFMSNLPGNPFRVTSNAGFTRQVWNNAASEVNSGDAFASFLLGTASGGSADYMVSPFFRSWYFAPYLQDDWKVSRKLTINMGLRWDYNPTVDEKHDRLVTGFDQHVKSPIAGNIPAAMLAIYPSWGICGEACNLLERTGTAVWRLYWTCRRCSRASVSPTGWEKRWFCAEDMGCFMPTGQPPTTRKRRASARQRCWSLRLTAAGHRRRTR
jgi:hypothetical protein